MQSYISHLNAMQLEADLEIEQDWLGHVQCDQILIQLNHNL